MGTNMAQMINHYHNVDFIFNNPYSFTDRYTAKADAYFADQPKHWNLRLFETNFIADVTTFGVDAWSPTSARTRASGRPITASWSARASTFASRRSARGGDNLRSLGLARGSLVNGNSPWTVEPLS
jgi:hypothetical protein